MDTTRRKQWFSPHLMGYLGTVLFVYEHRGQLMLKHHRETVPADKALGDLFGGNQSLRLTSSFVVPDQKCAHMLRKLLRSLPECQVMAEGFGENFNPFICVLSDALGDMFDVQGLSEFSFDSWCRHFKLRGSIARRMRKAVELLTLIPNPLSKSMLMQMLRFFLKMRGLCAQEMVNLHAVMTDLAAVGEYEQGSPNKLRGPTVYWAEVSLERSTVLITFDIRDEKMLGHRYGGTEKAVHYWPVLKECRVGFRVRLRALCLDQSLVRKMRASQLEHQVHRSELEPRAVLLKSVRHDVVPMDVFAANEG